MGTVTPFPSSKAIVQQDLIEMLERYLDAAKQGQITCVAMAAITPDRSAIYTFSEPDDALALMGAVRLLDRMLATHLDGEAD